MATASAMSLHKTLLNKDSLKGRKGCRVQTSEQAHQQAVEWPFLHDRDRKAAHIEGLADINMSASPWYANIVKHEKANFVSQQEGNFPSRHVNFAPDPPPPPFPSPKKPSIAATQTRRVPICS
eukprot:38134-Pelagomonas_calceolata.AAC.6